MKLTIDRKIWLRGEGSEHSILLNNADGRKCCLGIYLSSVGFSDEKIKQKRCPSDVIGSIPEWLLDNKKDSDLCKELICENDNEHIKEDDREKLIKDLFKKAGIEVEYIN